MVRHVYHRAGKMAFDASPSRTVIGWRKIGRGTQEKYAVGSAVLDEEPSLHINRVLYIQLLKPIGALYVYVLLSPQA
jgi:hypothetical protein